MIIIILIMILLLLLLLLLLSIGNSMICSDIWLKYYERYFKIVRYTKFHEPLRE